MPYMGGGGGLTANNSSFAVAPKTETNRKLRQSMPEADIQNAKLKNEMGITAWNRAKILRSSDNN